MTEVDAFRRSLGEAFIRCRPTGECNSSSFMQRDKRHRFCTLSGACRSALATRLGEVSEEAHGEHKTSPGTEKKHDFDRQAVSCSGCDGGECSRLSSLATDRG